MKDHNVSVEELRTYADEHVVYELQMLDWTTRQLMQNQGQMAKNVMLESFSVHVRNLADFLYARELRAERDGDVVIEDYIPSPSRSPISERLKRAREKAHKQVAHLTIDRMKKYASGEEKSWEFGTIYNDIVKAFKALAPQFTSPKISDSFRRYLGGIRSLAEADISESSFSGITSTAPESGKSA